MATEKKPARSTGKKSAAKKAEEKNIEEEKKKFQQKLIALKELAKSKKNVLELGEINNFLAYPHHTASASHAKSPGYIHKPAHPDAPVRNNRIWSHRK